MNFEDCKLKTNYLIKFKGTEIKAYVTSKEKERVFINSVNCTTTYAADECEIIKELK